MLLGLSILQLLQFTWLLLDRRTFLSQQLSRAWQLAYEQDPWTIRSMEDRWQCIGFNHSYDRHIHSTTDGLIQQGCYPHIEQLFGNVIYRWALIIWLIKCAQIMGGFLCYGLYVRYGIDYNDEDSRSDLEQNMSSGKD
ncbi:uncharacterized protein BX664DRAFT_333842 [Halteromyces radiatus]|uniref:uncharacterized protein n=1 Tax=Halteromyces radiatus TaxID=101107 RepID=UPI00221F46DD|nr:uncharacterized protein BX664DRAFT_333842 [Halteromyces radiatus]KAI8089767.1 hypothetical protein BX664DRAFT_333842 [Halteromyces radiatus]